MENIKKMERGETTYRIPPEAEVFISPMDFPFFRNSFTKVSKEDPFYGV